jgi:alkyl hydroperoxide reductase subunit AhpC
MRVCWHSWRIIHVAGQLLQSELCALWVQVCPAGWQPGRETIKPDPKGSKTYFANQKEV